MPNICVALLQIYAPMNRWVSNHKREQKIKCDNNGEYYGREENTGIKIRVAQRISLWQIISVNFDYFPFIRWTESSNTPIAHKHRFPIASHTIFNLITIVAIDCRWMLNIRNTYAAGGQSIVDRQHVEAKWKSTCVSQNSEKCEPAIERPYTFNAIDDDFRCAITWIECFVAHILRHCRYPPVNSAVSKVAIATWLLPLPRL